LSLTLPLTLTLIFPWRTLAKATAEAAAGIAAAG
jgi:hypothetical protein